MAFVTASTMSWTIQSLDITSAFLQGNGIERNVYLRPPTEVNSEGMIWKLKNAYMVLMTLQERGMNESGVS